MTQAVLHIRYVDPEVKEELKARAAARGWNLAHYLKQLLALHVAILEQTEQAGAGLTPTAYSAVLKGLGLEKREV